uniref:Sigma-70 family RNA polymerase sigma factor n=1 Tax=Thermocrinis ruber TaxID=75906 RepID=A0A7C5X1N7_9AQUI
MLGVRDIHRMAMEISLGFPEWVREEVYSAAVEGILRAIRRFDPSYGVKLSTYAYEYGKGYAYKEWKRWRRENLSLDYEYEDEDGERVRFEERLKADENVEERVSLEVLLEEVAQTEEERKIIRLLAEGYTFTEIAKKLGRSRTYIWQKIKNIKRRLEKEKLSATA